MLVRGLALCIAVSVSLVMAEGVAAAWLEWTKVLMPRLQTRFPERADKSTVNILVLGASSAVGVPYQDWLSIAEIVAWKMREAIPNRKYSIEYLARPGLTLDMIHFWMLSLKRRPDLVILYSGHNEFDSRYNWTHAANHYTDEMPPRRVTFESFARDHSPLCRLIQQTVGIFRIALPPPRKVTRQLVDVPVYTAAEYAERLHDFRIRLEAMVSYCEGLGALVVMVSPPCNDADFEPSRSFLPSGTTRAERQEFGQAFEAARQLEKAEPVQAIAAYRGLLRASPCLRMLTTGWPACWRRPASGMRRTSTTWRHAIATASRCDACPTSWPPILRSRRDIPARFWSMGRKFSENGALAARSVTSSSRTVFIPH